MPPKKKSVPLLKRLAVLADACLILSMPIVAYAIRTIQAPEKQLEVYSLVYILFAGLAGLTFWLMMGLHKRSMRFAGRQDGTGLAVVAMAAPFVGLVASFMDGEAAVLPRSVPILHGLALFVAMISIRVIARNLAMGNAFGLGQRDEEDEAAISALSFPIKQSKKHRAVVVVGDGLGLSTWLKAADALLHQGVEPLALIPLDLSLRGRIIRGRSLYNGKAGLGDILEGFAKTGQHVSRIVIACPMDALPADYVASLARANVPVSAFGDLGRDDNLTQIAPSGAAKLAPSVRAFLPIKRAMDVLFAAVGLILAAVPLGIAALMVRIFMGSPVIFWQWRPGRHGRAFRVLKLRSMHGAYDRNGKRLADEARLGKLGLFLRRTRLDELPQLWSIFIGDMSLIGPRPLISQQQDPDHPRLRLRPGLTGWAQVNGGQLLSDEDKMAMDEEYVAKASFWFDIKIIWMTVLVVLRGDKLPEGLKGKADPFAGAQLAGDDDSGYGVMTSGNGLNDRGRS